MYLPELLRMALSSSSSRLQAPCHLLWSSGSPPPGGITGSCDSLGLPLPELIALGQQHGTKELWNLGQVNTSVPQFPHL